MITTSPNINIESSGIQCQSDFKIRASRKAFQILSSGLYSDKKKAIVRELLANAVDAHIAAHNPESPLVHLPNQFEPFFSIRDYGTGLSDESIFTVYTTYFESTKTESNDYTGCLGLGSKSPFSYVDSFTVIGYFDGVKRTYNAYLNEHGVPAIARLHEEATTEHNGLEIIIPVKDTDFDEFRMKLETVAKRFKIQPKVVGNSEYKMKPVEYSLHGTGWALRTLHNTGMIAAMGNIGYPIDLKDGSLTNAQQEALKLPVDLFFNIGELDIAASRESLSFDIVTVKNIKIRLDSFIAELKQLIGDKFLNCRTLWEARCLHYEIFCGEYRAFSEMIQSSALQWNGIPLSSTEIRNDSGMYVRLFRSSATIGYERRRTTTLREGKSVDSIAPRKETLFVIEEDDCKSMYRRCAHYCETHPNIKYLYFLSPSEAPDKLDVVLSGNPQNPVAIIPAYPTAQEQLDKLVLKLGIDPNDIAKISALELPPRIVRSGYGTGGNGLTDTGKARILRLSSNYSRHDCASNWIAETVDVAQGGIYVEVNRYKIQNTFGTPLFSSVYDLYRNVLNEIEAAGISIRNTPIYGVKTSFLPRIKNNPKWVKFEDYCRAIIKDAVSRNEQNISNAIATDHFVNNNAIFYMNKIVYLLGKVDASKPFGKFLAAYKSMSMLSKDSIMFRSLWSIANKFGILGNDCPAHDLKSLQEKVVASYPMLGLLNTADNKFEATQRHLEVIEEYVKFLD